MKGNYRRNSTNNNTTKRISRIFFAGLCLYLLILLLRSLFGGFVSLTNSSVIGVSGWLFDSQNSIPAYFRAKNDLLYRIQELEAEMAGRSGERMVVESLLSENIELRSLLNGSTTPRVVASIISRPPQLNYDALLLDVGTSDGVHEGAVVYLGRNKAVGVIIRSETHFSVAKLVTSPEVESTVYIIGPDVYTTAIGMGGGVMQVNVPQGLPLEKGDLVVVPALGSGFFGEVEEVVSVPTEPVQYGFVTSQVPLQELRLVSVSLEPAQTMTFEEINENVETAILSTIKVDVPYSALDGATTTATSTASSTDEALNSDESET